MPKWSGTSKRTLINGKVLVLRAGPGENPTRTIEQSSGLRRCLECSLYELAGRRCTRVHIALCPLRDRGGATGKENVASSILDSDRNIVQLDIVKEDRAGKFGRRCRNLDEDGGVGDNGINDDLQIHYQLIQCIKRMRGTDLASDGLSLLSKAASCNLEPDLQTMSVKLGGYLSDSIPCSC